jgi:hypothetical protein
MANFVFNIAKGRVAELYNRVDTNDPTNAQLIVLAINTTATDATLMDLATVAAIEADANTAEVTNANYARKLLVDTDLGLMTVDNTNDRMPLDLPDQTWTSVAVGTAWTDLIIAYDSDSTAGTDANVTPLTCHDFAVTPNGGNITAQINDFYRAS